MVQHQAFQRQISHLQLKIQEKDTELTELAQALESVHRKLSEALHITRPVAERSSRSKVALQETISYAHRVAATTSAPFNYKDGDLLKSHAPPHPLETQWKASLLYPS